MASGPISLADPRELGQARCLAIVQAKKANCETSSLGCWFPRSQTGARISTNNDGYCQVFQKPNWRLNESGRDAQRGYLLHRVSFVAAHGRDPVHASHLCDHRACFNLDHIVDESAAQNNARKNCIGSIRCPFHQHYLVECPHTPACVRMPYQSGRISCCLALLESDQAGWRTSPTFPSSPPGPSSAHQVLTSDPAFASGAAELEAAVIAGEL